MGLFKQLMAGTVFLLFFSCNSNKTDNPEQAVQKAPLFYGRVTYSIVLSSGDSSLLKSLSSFTPTKVEAYFAENKFRLIEYGGASRGNILIFPNKQEAWQLDTTTRMAYLADYSDFNDPGDELMDIMPDHFAPTIEATNETETILGVVCKKYKVVRSGFIPTADEASIWVTEDFRFPSSRFDVQSEINRVIVPLPLYIGYEDGAIMRLRVSNKNYSATYEITGMDRSIPDPAIFSIPEGYAKK